MPVVRCSSRILYRIWCAEVCQTVKILEVYHIFTNPFGCTCTILTRKCSEGAISASRSATVCAPARPVHSVSCKTFRGHIPRISFATTCVHGVRTSPTRRACTHVMLGVRSSRRLTNERTTQPTNQRTD